MAAKAGSQIFAPSQMWTRKKFAGQDDAFAFSDETSDDTWIGQLDDADSMRDEEIAEYVKASKPDLFHQLRGLPTKSSDIPLSFHGVRTLQRLSNIRQSSGSNTSISPSPLASVKPQYEKENQRPHSSPAEKDGAFAEAIDRIHRKLQSKSSLVIVDHC